MLYEIPIRHLVELEIVRINQRLFGLGEVAASRDYTGVDVTQFPAIDVDELRPGLTPAAFWNHYISGGISATDGLPQDMVDLVRSNQRRLHILTERWMVHPAGSRDPLNLTSCQDFMAVGFLFDWSHDPALANSLKGILVDLGYQYALREGRRPLGYIPQ